ncbi:MAG: hypothetical protein HKN47_06320 [Pirellulaceae bacterium]|nr:hypothetical protein [Pirellulaceae bacterium]
MHFATRRVRLAIMMVGLCLFSVVGGNATADEYQAQTPVGRMMQGLNPQNWKMPSFRSLLPGQSEKDRIVTKKDSLVTEVKNTAQRSWTRTKTTLNPMKLIPVGFRTPSADSAPAPTTESSGPGFFGSLFGGKSEPAAEVQPETTVNDFLRQTKPIR